MIPFSDLLILAVLVLLVFGPRRLPEIGRIVGKALGEFRKASNDLRRTINAELALEEQQPKARPAGPTRWPPAPDTPATPPDPAPEPPAEPASAVTENTGAAH